VLAALLLLGAITYAALEFAKKKTSLRPHLSEIVLLMDGNLFSGPLSMG
jgi:hypothetical protein